MDPIKTLLFVYSPDLFLFCARLFFAPFTSRDPVFDFSVLAFVCGFMEIKNGLRLFRVFIEPFQNPLKLDKVRFVCISVSLDFVCFLGICLVLFELILRDRSSVLHGRFSCCACIVFL